MCNSRCDDQIQVCKYIGICIFIEYSNLKFSVHKYEPYIPIHIPITRNKPKYNDRKIIFPLQGFSLHALSTSHNLP